MLQVVNKAPPILATMAQVIYKMLPDALLEGRQVVWQNSLQLAFYPSPLTHFLLLVV